MIYALLMNPSSSCN